MIGRIPGSLSTGREELRPLQVRVDVQSLPVAAHLIQSTATYLVGVPTTALAVKVPAGGSHHDRITRIRPPSRRLFSRSLLSRRLRSRSLLSRRLFSRSLLSRRLRSRSLLSRRLFSRSLLSRRLFSRSL